jgi:hypothetical protein
VNLWLVYRNAALRARREYGKRVYDQVNRFARHGIYAPGKVK